MWIRSRERSLLKTASYKSTLLRQTQLETQQKGEWFMKKLTALGLVALAVTVATAAIAEDKTFTVSATVPAATGFSINASRVDSTTNQFTPVATSELGFDPLTLTVVDEDTGDAIFLPDHYFAIDVGSVGGAGNPDVTLTYLEGLNPNATNPNTPPQGLGWKATTTFLRITKDSTGQEQQTGITAQPKRLLKDLTGVLIDDSDIGAGFLRIILGLYTGDTTGQFPDSGGFPFSQGDAPGQYTGQLTISATAT